MNILYNIRRLYDIKNKKIIYYKRYETINDLREKNILIDGEKYFVDILKYEVSPESQDESYSLCRIYFSTLACAINITDILYT